MTHTKSINDDLIRLNQMLDVPNIIMRLKDQGRINENQAKALRKNAIAECDYLLMRLKLDADNLNIEWKSVK